MKIPQINADLAFICSKIVEKSTILKKYWVNLPILKEKMVLCRTVIHIYITGDGGKVIGRKIIVTCFDNFSTLPHF